MVKHYMGPHCFKQWWTCRRGHWGSLSNPGLFLRSQIRSATHHMVCSSVAQGSRIVAPITPLPRSRGHLPSTSAVRIGVHPLCSAPRPHYVGGESKQGTILTASSSMVEKKCFIPFSRLLFCTDLVNLSWATPFSTFEVTPS